MGSLVNDYNIKCVFLLCSSFMYPVGGGIGTPQGKQLTFFLYFASFYIRSFCWIRFSRITFKWKNNIYVIKFVIF